MSENQRIKEIRKFLKINQASFGESIGLTQSAITLLESGKSKLTDQTKILLTHIYGVRREFIENGEEPMFYKKYKGNDVDENNSLEEVVEYSGQVAFLKGEIDKWRDKYFELNEKYIKLLEAQLGGNSPENTNRTA